MERAPYRLTALALAILAWAVLFTPFALAPGGIDLDLALAGVAGGLLVLAVIARDGPAWRLRALRALRRHMGLVWPVAALTIAGGLAVLLAYNFPTEAAAVAIAAVALPAPRPGAGRSSPTSLRPTVDGMKWDPARWPNFSPRELACNCPVDDRDGCEGEYFHDAAFLDALQRLRDLVGAPLRITSGHRCERRNKRVGGASRSQHLRIAADIGLAGHDPAALARHAVAAGFTGIGFGRSFLHVDMRPGREGFHYPGGQAVWTKRFGFDPAARFDATGKL